MNYILAIDQGGSHTRAAVSDTNGNIIGYHSTGGACHSIDGMELSMQMISEASEIAIQDAGLQKSDICLLYSGMTGADFEYEYKLLQNSISELNICKNITVKNDCIIALRGGTLQPYGTIVNAGTGINCAIISPQGEEFIYQYFAQDNLQGGSAFSKRMLDAIYESATFRSTATLLTQSVLSHFSFKTVDELLLADAMQKLTRKERLSIVPLVFEAAEQDDEISRKIIQKMATSFANLVVGGVRRFGMEDTEFEVVISGGIFKAKGNLLIDTFTNEVNKVASKAKIVNAIYEPIIGAVLLAIEQLFSTIDNNTLHNIDKSCEKFGLYRNN